MQPMRTTSPAVSNAATLDAAAADRTLAAWLAAHHRIFVLTGAGCSTASGIPDYRDADGAWKRAQPVTYQAFTGDASTYRRYWARSALGWPRVDGATPNAAHVAIARLQQCGRVGALVTQNVDGLHQRAGSRDVIDLHGRLGEVVCLGCGERTSRATLQARMLERNRGWGVQVASAAPDGDADIDPAAIDGFVPPLCEDCGGLVKPDVVFFGENVPRERLTRALEALGRADAVLVAGSSLMVYSGFRFARMAAEAGLPLAILNRGRTRADELATLKLASDAGRTLQGAVSLLAS